MNECSSDRMGKFEIKMKNVSFFFSEIVSYDRMVARGIHHVVVTFIHGCMHASMMLMLSFMYNI